MDPVTLTTQLEPIDIRRFTNFAMGHVYRRGLLFLAIFMVALNLLGNLTDHSAQGSELHDNGLAVKVLTACVIAILYTAFCAVALRLYLRWASRPSVHRHISPSAFLQNTYTLRDEGLLCQNEHSEVLQFWSSIQRFVEVKDYFYLMLARRRGYIFPKRCFPTHEAAAVFANQVRLHLEKHAPQALDPRAR